MDQLFALVHITASGWGWPKNRGPGDAFEGHTGHRYLIVTAEGGLLNCMVLPRGTPIHGRVIREADISDYQLKPVARINRVSRLSTGKKIGTTELGIQPWFDLLEMCIQARTLNNQLDIARQVGNSEAVIDLLESLITVMNPISTLVEMLEDDWLENDGYPFNNTWIPSMLRGYEVLEVLFEAETNKWIRKNDLKRREREAGEEAWLEASRRAERIQTLKNRIAENKVLAAAGNWTELGVEAPEVLISKLQDGKTIHIEEERLWLEDGGLVIENSLGVPQPLTDDPTVEYLTEFICRAVAGVQFYPDLLSPP